MTPQPISVLQRDHLRILSGQLLRLHKLLLDHERAEYEKTHAPINSTGEFLNLVLDHPSFEWLRRLSGLIVEIDEIRAPRSKANDAEAEAAIELMRTLLVPDQAGTAFQKRYWSVMQDLGEVAILHREILPT
jgi:hypothetical protein